ncbi:MAG: hypothetical protein OQK78_08775 [Gammaproteobacteria bacterium]|nr:hypothetical protein [Gammaproteobacteria bacterium]MCW8888175.1 hypothetical protein [Gammaproteobacteria bacterium]MCW8982473.1 hypothetical protein [Gammaproteobacteria bacterium]
MPRLLDIREDYVRDLNMHYTGSVWKDLTDSSFMLIMDVQEHRDGVRIVYQDSKKDEQFKSCSMEELRERFKAISLEDGFINLNGYCLYAERTIDGKYKKTTTLNNTSVEPLGHTYIRVNNKRVKRNLDAYTCMKALKAMYYSFDDALRKIENGEMFSVAMSDRMAIVKQPVADDTDRAHVVYYDVYVGEIKDQQIQFVDEAVRGLVIEQLEEVGYAA